MEQQSDLHWVQDRIRQEAAESDRRQRLSSLADEAAVSVRDFWGTDGSPPTTTRTERWLWAHAIETMVAKWRDDGREAALQSLVARYAESVGEGTDEGHKQLRAAANRWAARVFSAAITRKSHRYIATVLKEAEAAGVLAHLNRSLSHIATGDSCDAERQFGAVAIGRAIQRLLDEEAARFTKQEPT